MSKRQYSISQEQMDELRMYLYYATSEVSKKQIRYYTFTPQDQAELELWKNLPWEVMVQGVIQNYKYTGVTVKKSFLDIKKEITLKW